MWNGILGRAQHYEICSNSVQRGRVMSISEAEEGTMSVLVGEEWFEAAKGSFVLVPGGITHDFENRGSVRAGVLNFSVPGPFEPEMPGIAEWFARNPPKDTGT